MSNNEAGSAVHHLRKGVLNLDLSSGINRGCSLVQNKHRRQAEHNAGYAQKLLLTLRKASAVLGYHGVVTLRQTLYEAVRVRRLRSRNDFLVCGVGLAHYNVVADSSGAQPGFLKDHTVAASQAVSGRIPYICALDCNGAAVDVVESHQQVDYSSLSAAGRTYYSDTLTRLNTEVQSLDELSVGYI